MNTDQLQLFLAIAHHRSLARAAIEMELGQATVSERLKTLEAEVGTQLFARQGRGVSLTPAGAAFRPYAERALEVIREAQESARAASEGRTGQVTVAVTVTAGAFLFAPALVAFQREHPHVEVRVRSAHSWDAPGLILDGVVELALVSGPVLHPQIETVATFSLPLILVTGKGHPRAGQSLTLAELAREQLLVSYWGSQSQMFLEQVRAADETHTSMWLELSPVELVKGLLVAGTGVSLVPQIAVRRELEAGDLVQLQWIDKMARLPKWEVALIRYQRRPVNPAAASLLATLSKALKQVIK